LGGYTGQFSLCLRDLGFKIIFTDPLEEWIENAVALKFEAYKYSIEQLVTKILEKTDMLTTFECYPPFISERVFYIVLRCLTPKYGILFAESKLTRDEIDKEIGSAGGRLKDSFLPYKKTYSINRIYREKVTLDFIIFGQMMKKGN
jgi:hypothetical protein